LLSTVQIAREIERYKENSFSLNNAKELRTRTFEIRLDMREEKLRIRRFGVRIPVGAPKFDPNKKRRTLDFKAK
jgi:hypothetical protein